jgi:intein-encoded DNA endonuclease-like protein
MGRKKISIDKNSLANLYHGQSLSTHKIGTMLNCSWATIANRLKEYNIPLKSSSIARIKYKRNDFSSNLEEKGYMLGFRMGDLNIYSPTINSETIVARCHTTQEEQVSVIKDLFSRYGQITVSRAKGHFHVNCYLNQSFKFLLDKNEDAWSWVDKSSKFYIPFIAGYTDAEANFIINQGRARFKLDSYDLLILRAICGWLSRSKIHFKFRQISKKGDTQFIYGLKSRYNGDLWRLNINDALSLKKFILLIKPYLKHAIRINQINQCLINIEDRIINGTI